MAQSRLEFRIPVLKLLIGLLLTVIPISLAGLYTITASERSLDAVIGGYFKTIAGATAAEVSQYINDRVTGVAEMSIDPAVVEAAQRANRAYVGMSEEAVGARIRQIDQGWNGASTETLVREIMNSPASQLLRRLRMLDPRLLRITVTDERGATIAGTHKSLDYYQADEEYWQNIVAGGRGTVSLTDILFDEATNSNYIGIGMPIREEQSQRVIGTVDALVDVSSLLPLINRHQIGPTGRTMLVKDDGTVISGPGVTLSKKLQSEEYAAVRDSLGTLRGRQTGFLVAELPQSGPTLMAFADTGLRESYPKLAWVALVAQDGREAFAPVRMIGRMLFFMSLLGIAVVAVLSAFYAIHSPQRRSEIGELRPPAPPKA